MEGKQIGNFRIIQKLGEGGMGVVYKGLDVQLERPVAIKMLNLELARNPELVQRFQAEARAQANLNHTNIATLYAFLVAEEGACMVMEFVEGETFDQLIRRGGPMNPRDAVPLFKQALLGIGAAHRMGIVHRDIKPANLMLNRQGIVKVMDFGIAKALGTRGMTRTGMQMGTLAYMSPEQIQNRGIDVRTDIYALGVTLYEMLTGHVPFESDSDFQVMHDHVSTPPPALTRSYPYAPREFENAVAKALEKSPDHRFQTVEEFGAALEHPENVPASSYSMPAPLPVRSTTIETQPNGAPGSASVGAAAVLAPSFTPVPAGSVPGPAGPGYTPAPVGTVPGATGPGVTPAPVGTVPGTVPPVASATQARVGSMTNKVVAGVVIVAAVALLAIFLRPKAPSPGGGGASPGGVSQSSNKPTAPPPRNDSPNILIASGGRTTPESNTTTGPVITGASKDNRPRQKAAGTPVKQSQAPSTQRQPGQQLAQQAQADQPQPQVQQPQTQVQQPQTQVQQPPPQPTPQPQPTRVQHQQQAAQGQSFPVKHRHIVMNGFQSYTFFCGGWLTVRPDGSVTYICSGTNDPSGRCDKVMFPAGSIKQAKLRGGGELHISTSGMGNWDFYDLNIAGSTASAYQAIQALGR